MTTTQKIPAERLSDLNVHEGDTLRILAVLDSTILVQISRVEDAPPSKGKVSEWLRTAVGSVKLAPGETVDDVRMGYYEEKYGLNRETK